MAAARVGVVAPLGAQSQMEVPLARDNADALTGSVVELEMLQQNKMDEKIEGE